ncbi:hypothetical protein [Faecalitalea cylindroides]|uniref:Uncharacterized protein n=1 Tax=Faecalitalea cylindroides TaxID=39483 RepID=A0AAW6FR04_9FIRM|nr:hypothetical protein [Faecalitalea cylindroides]MDC0827347.1 hypothetical protein [Faecalitalea cylindroides]
MEVFFVFLLSLGVLNPIYSNILFSFLYITIIQYIKTKKILLNSALSINFWALFLFGITYFLFGGLKLQHLEFFLITPLLVYSFGWTLIELRGGKDVDFIKRIIFAMLIGFGVHAFLNYISNIGVTRWLLTDFFTGSIQAATGSGVLNTMIFSLLAYLLFIEKDKKIKILGLVLEIVACIYSFQLGGRTQLIILGLVFVIIFFFYLFEKKGFVPTFKTIMRLAILVILVYIVYQLDIFSIKTSIESSNLLLRLEQGGLEASDQYRINSVLNGLLSLINHPFGGQETVFYFHNMWLDVGRVSGVFPFLFLLLYSVLATYHVLMIFLNKNYNITIRYLFLSLYLGIQINFFTEPIMEGAISFFLAFCFLSGLVDYMYYRTRRFL